MPDTAPLFPKSTYRFRVSTAFGDVDIEMPRTEWDSAAEVTYKDDGTETGRESIAVAILRFAMESDCFDPWGHIVDIDFASPMSINHILRVCRGRHDSIMGFEIFGFVPDSLPDDARPSEEDGVVE